jgi:ClpP class serine protease
MTNSEILQYIEGNTWLVTEGLASSFRSLINSGEGIAFEEIAKRREQHNATNKTLVFTAGKKLMPYKEGKKRQPMPSMDNEIYTDDGEGETEEDKSIVSPEGIAVMRIKGVLHKDSDYCNKGTMEINADLMELGEDPRIKGVILCIDSGGGEVAGTEQLADTIYNFKRAYGKRIEAVVYTAGSAAYWLASGCDKIYLVGQTSSVGSIGTMATLVNSEGLMQAAGISIINIYATLSYNKNKEYDDALAGNPAAMRTEVLDKINTVFLAAVIRGRYRSKYKVEELTLENTPPELTGKIYFGKDAIAVGLADSIGTLEQALVNFDTRTAGSLVTASEEPAFTIPAMSILTQPKGGLTILKPITKN